MIHGDSALGQQFPRITVGQAIPQVPADRDRDDLGRNRKRAKTEPEPDDLTSPVSRSPRSTNATVPVWLIQSLLPAPFQQPALGREDQARSGIPRLALQLTRASVSSG